MCYVHLQYFCEHGGCLRIYCDGFKYENRDLYCWSCSFEVKDLRLIELQGVYQAPRNCQARTLFKSLRQQNIRFMRERKSGANPGIKLFK